MKKRVGHLAICLAASAVIAVSLSGCGQRVEQDPVKQTEPATEAPTEVPVKIVEPVTEKETETETESETQKLITSVDYTSKDGSVKITLPDNTWKVKQDADEMRVFQSESAAIINIVHADTDSAMKGLSVMTSREELETSLEDQYSDADAFDVTEFTSAVVNGVNVIRYTVKYNATARMWAYSVTDAFIAQDQAYVVTGTVTDDNAVLLDEVKKAVESFRVLKDESLRAVTADVLTGTQQQMTEKVDTQTVSQQEMASMATYGKSVNLVTTDTVNVRLAPGTDSDILTTLAKQTQVVVTGESRNWFQVNISGNTGYIRKDFLVYGNTVTPETTAQTEAPVNTGTVSAAELGTATTYAGSTTLYASEEVNVRMQPGTDSDIIDSLAGGSAVTVTGETDNWFIVSVNGATGYVSKAYLTYDSSPAVTTPADNQGQQGGTGNSQGTQTNTVNEASQYTGTVSGTVTGSTVDSITVQGDDGNTYTIYYGDANVSTQDGLYNGVYVNVAVDGSQAADDGTMYATNVTGY